MYSSTISTRPEDVEEPQRDFPLVLRLPGLRPNQFVCFALDAKGKEVLESKEYINDPGNFVITIPELSATEPTTIYILSDQHILDQPEPPDTPSRWDTMTDSEIDIATELDAIDL